jgi:tetratricopeptide (TPR) repeat protein
MASKPGRNDPCPCGSGQKYKRCCLEKDQIAQSAALADTATAQANATRALAALLREHIVEDEDNEDELTRDSNAVVDLVHEGKLDEAEQAARNLLECYPEVHDGYDRLGMVYEARGEPKQAADCYRKVIEFIRAHPDQYGPDLHTVFEDMVAELDPPSAT